jgi:hypothetical protein
MRASHAVQRQRAKPAARAEHSRLSAALLAPSSMASAPAAPAMATSASTGPVAYDVPADKIWYLDVIHIAIV